MDYPKPLVAFVLAVTISGLFWMLQATMNRQQLSLAFPAPTPGAGLELGFTESDATNASLYTSKTCPEIFPNEIPFGKGSSNNPGRRVRQLQDFLVATGYLKDSDVSGNYGTFGQKTVDALTQFQKDKNVYSEKGTAVYGKYDAMTDSNITVICDNAINPKTHSIFPATATAGDAVTLAGDNLPRRKQVQVNLYNETDIKGNGAIQFQWYAWPESNGSIKLRLDPSIGAGKYWMRVRTQWGYTQDRYHDGGLTPILTVADSFQSSNTCDAIGNPNSCVANTNPICEWYNGTCKLPSCGGLSVATGTNDSSKYQVYCGKKPGSAWSLLGATDDCGWYQGSTNYGCFYTSVDGSANPPPREPGGIRNRN